MDIYNTINTHMQTAHRCDTRYPLLVRHHNDTPCKKNVYYYFSTESSNRIKSIIISRRIYRIENCTYNIIVSRPHSVGGSMMSSGYITAGTFVVFKDIRFFITGCWMNSPLVCRTHLVVLPLLD